MHDDDDDERARGRAGRGYITCCHHQQWWCRFSQAMHVETSYSQRVGCAAMPCVYNIITNEPPHYLLFATAVMTSGNELMVRRTFPSIIFFILVPATIELPMARLTVTGDRNVVISAEMETAQHHSDMNDDLNLIDDVDPSEVYQLREGGDLDLTCRVRGQPLPIVTWKFQVFYNLTPIEYLMT